ncbi:MAG: hydrogenase [Alphaproteobacteria bacterium HGW-Alphaproteobacteria-6]|nr:MAG: hydrogenase [Alphaproteobacteria bacterium HGW-Alphaproteobacteria-6]
MRKLLIEGLIRRPLTEPAPKPDDAALDALGRRVGAALHRRLGRSLAIRMVDAGSCNGCELEINALGNPFYDLERFGLRFVASPRHADVLMVTGPVTHNMAEALRRSWDAVPEPRWVVAVVAAVLPVDLHIAGCPPRPAALLEGLLALLEHAAAGTAAR